VVRVEFDLVGTHAVSASFKQITERIGLLSRRARIAVRSTVRQVHFDTNSGAENSILLAGGGRGGTTWIAEMINFDNAFRFIFEPFWGEKVPAARSFHNPQYIRPNNVDPTFLDPARQVMSGRIRNGWTDFHNRRLVSNRRLIKDIRANLFLMWIRRNFPQTPIVMLMRHPCAVVSSRLHSGWTDNLQAILDQRPLVEDWLEPFRERILAAKPGFEAHLFRWCIENWVPMQQFREGEIYLAFYEEFCEQPADAIAGLFGYLGRPVTDEVFSAVDKPSSQTWRKNSAVKFGERMADRWRKHVTAAELAMTLKVLTEFGLETVYGEDTLPNADGARRFLRATKSDVRLPA
jgi:hypothetical protein